MTLFAIFFIGAALGSFLCVLVDRLPRGEQVLRGRSKCDKCHKTLAPLELIPIISYVILRGRCRHCRSQIPMHLFFTEVACGAMAILVFLYGQQTGMAPIYSIFLFIIMFSILGIFMADLMSGIIPDEFVAIMVISTPLLILAAGSRDLIGHAISGLIAFIFFLALFIITRGRGMGFGDVKYSFAMGFFLGLPGLVVGLYFGFLTATFISLILIFTGRKKLRGDTIVFGPFLAAGTVFAFLFSDKIIGLFF